MKTGYITVTQNHNFEGTYSVFIRDKRYVSDMCVCKYVCTRAFFVMFDIAYHRHTYLHILSQNNSFARVNHVRDISNIVMLFLGCVIKPRNNNKIKFSIVVLRMQKAGQMFVFSISSWNPLYSKNNI